MFACPRGVDRGSPPVASCSVDAPSGEWTTSVSLLTSSPSYSRVSISGGSTGMYSLKWLVMSSDAGSSVIQHGAE